MAKRTDPDAKFVSGLARRLKNQPGVVLEPDNIARAARLSDANLLNLRQAMRKARVPLTEFNRALEAEKKAIAAAVQATVPQPDGVICRTDTVSVPELMARIQSAIQQVMPDTIFLRSGELVRLRTIEKAEEVSGVTMHPGLVVIQRVEAGWLGEEMQRRGVKFVKPDSDGVLQETPPPWSALAQFASQTDARRFPPLKGISMVPTLNRDVPGYDPTSRLYLAFPPDMFPPAPENPSLIDAQDALVRLERPLREYRFKDAASRAVVLSAFLCAVVRQSMRTCPLHVFDAPMAGAGKTKLANCVGIIATGTKPSHASFGRNEEENQKVLTTMLLRGNPVTSFDNVEHTLGGAFLNQVLTEEQVMQRLLGEHRELLLSTATLMLATGNKVRMKDDQIVRRAVKCTIAIGDQKPSEVEHTFDPVDDVMASRSQMVVDALTIVRAWIAAGRPLPRRYRTMASFEDYDVVRGALIWADFLDQADPAETQRGMFEEDEKFEERAEVLQALWTRFGGDPFLAREVTAPPDHHDPEHERLQEEVYEALRHHVEDWKAIRIGKLLQAHCDIPTGSLVLREAGIDKHHRTKIWRLERIGDGGCREAIVGENNQELAINSRLIPGA